MYIVLCHYRFSVAYGGKRVCVHFLFCYYSVTDRYILHTSRGLSLEPFSKTRCLGFCLCHIHDLNVNVVVGTDVNSSKICDIKTFNSSGSTNNNQCCVATAVYMEVKSKMSGKLQVFLNKIQRCN